jgi:hypothetical protein
VIGRGFPIGGQPFQPSPVEFLGAEAAVESPDPHTLGCSDQGSGRALARDLVPESSGNFSVSLSRLRERQKNGDAISVLGLQFAISPPVPHARGLRPSWRSFQLDLGGGQDCSGDDVASLGLVSGFWTIPASRSISEPSRASGIVQRAGRARSTSRVSRMQRPVVPPKPLRIAHGRFSQFDRRQT